MAQREATGTRKSKPKSAKKKAARSKKIDGAEGANVVHLSNMRPPSAKDEESFVIWAGKIKRQRVLVKKAEDALRSERGSLGTLYTAAKEGGIPGERLRILKQTLREEDRDAAERLAEAREMAFQAKALKSPMIQLGMFDGLLKAPTMEEFELMGEHAGKNGESIDGAPGKPGSPEHTHYVSGWKKGQAANVKALEKTMKAGGEEGGGGKPPSTGRLDLN